MHDIKDLEGLEIFLGYACNVKCNFCYQKNLRYKYSKNIPYKEVISLMERGRKNNKKFIIFSWWEPTLDKYLPLYISHAKDIWFQHIRVHTNGFGFRKFSYLLDLYNRGMSWVTISVHWYKEVHDIITQSSWSFQRIHQALNNFHVLKQQDHSFIFDTNTVVCKQNYKHLNKLIVYLSQYEVTRWQIVLSYSLDLFNTADKKNIIPKYVEVIPYLESLVEISRKFKKKFVLENIPFCVTKKAYWESIINNIKIRKDSITIKEWNIWNTNITWMQYWDKCNNCSVKNSCRGIPKDYHEIYGDSFVNPILW